MAASLVIGNTLVSTDEFSERQAIGDLSRFAAALEENHNASIEFSTGEVSIEDLSFDSNANAATPSRTPIGYGKPLSIEILAAYTGNIPWRLPLTGKSDVMVVSGIKSIQTFEASPRAINQIVRDIEEKQHIFPAAFNEGSPIVYYMPSLVNGTTLCSFELVTESFARESVQRIGSLFSAAAGLPVFAPASAFLLAGSLLTNIAADLGHALIERKPLLRSDIDLRFETPELPIAVASHIVLYNDEDAAEFSGYDARVVSDGVSAARMRLINRRSGEAYTGRAPYVIATIDGRIRSELENYMPTLASAAMLEKFYGPAGKGGQVISALTDAMKLYNDFQFRQKAERFKKQMNELTKDTVEYQTALKMLDAYLGNIQNEHMRVFVE